MNIITTYWAKPIPLRQYDWSAVTDNHDLGSPVGFGRTEQEAIDDLRIVACEACGTEGRIYHGDGDKPWHYLEECPYCEGTGGEIITTQPIEMADLDGEGDR